MKKKTTSVQMPDALREKVEKEAKLQRRSVSAHLVVIIERYFADKDNGR